jgi:hypothetical protein
MDDLIKLVKTYRFTEGMAERLSLAENKLYETEETVERTSGRFFSYKARPRWLCQLPGSL